MAAVCDGGFYSLNPCATIIESGSRAALVECIDLKPCLVGLAGRIDRVGRMNFSRILLVGQRSDIDL